MNSRESNESAISLAYKGKSLREDVLATLPGTYQPLREPRAGENRLYYADNLRVLASLLQEPEIKERVTLVYIDPPFATASAFKSVDDEHAYDDRLVGEEYIEELRKRLILIHSLLSKRGSLYLHLDGRMIFHAKLILDEIFGGRNFRNLITRRKSNPKNYTRKTYGKISDYILFYSKGSVYTWNRPVVPWDDKTSKREYQYIDEDGRRYKRVPVHAPGTRNGETGQPWRGRMPPPGKHWQYRPDTLDEMDARGEIYWSANGNPRRKVYLDQAKGVPVQDIWHDVRDAFNQNHYVTGYPTEKNPALMKRIIEASSNEGDIVLDCYSGSGTTLEQASLLNRRWIGVDNSEAAIATTLQRFEVGAHRLGDYVTPDRQLAFPSHRPIRGFNIYREISELPRHHKGKRAGWATAIGQSDVP